MKKNILLLLLIFIISESTPLFAQKESNIWYFGNHAGLDFNSGFPQALLDGKLNSEEGAAAISDTNGSLLFYTEGSTIWNKNHQIMQNGDNLLGHENSSQSAIILRQPGSYHLYFVFTLPHLEEPTIGLNYSIIDMNLDSGMGAVTNEKNIHLHSPAYDYMTAVMHADSVSFWVVVFDWHNNKFLSYLLTEDGLNTEAVISPNLVQYESEYPQLGLIKASIDGRYIVSSQWATLTIGLHNFNNQTGKLSNNYRIDDILVGPVWGAEFSPSGRFLYLLSGGINNRLIQYDLSASLINPQGIIVGSFPFLNSIITSGNMELGPDRKIYAARWSLDYISYIKYPDLYGTACNFVEYGVDLNGRNSSASLPPIVPYLLYTDFLFENPCLGKPTEFTIQASNYDSLIWNFGDPASGLHNFSSEPNPTHIFSDVGYFNVVLTAYTNGYADSATHQLRIYNPIADIGPDTTICSYNDLILINHSNDTNVLWMDEYHGISYAVEQEGFYWIEVTQEGCIQYDTVEVKIIEPPNKPDLGNDTTICIDQFLTLIANIDDADFMWNDGSEDSIITVSQEGLYSVFVSNECGTSTDSIYLSIVDCECEPQIPNAFTPNGDGINDYFNIVSNCIFSSFNMQIYNRWGAKIFESKDINNSWDGLVNNKQAIQGTYIYKLEYKISHASEANKMKGTFTLIN